MSVTLINGDGNPRVLASQDADWYGALTGQKTCIIPINDNLSATITDSNTVEIGSGVCITKEGRRVQIDEGDIEEIIIPTGTQGVDTYYIIGFHLYINESGQQVAETFVETMASATDTITETTFKEGSSNIYVSLYRVKRSGLLMDGIERLAPIEAGGMANEIYKYNGVMGAKNLFTFPYYTNTTTVNGITYTVNDDGTITVNGTATALSVFTIANYKTYDGNETAWNKIVESSSGKFRLTGCPSGGSTSTYYLQCTGGVEGHTSWWGGGSDTGNGITFSANIDGNKFYIYVCRIVVNSGVVCNNLVFKPMLRDAVDTDEAYRPYAKTNKQLTDDVSQINSDLSEWVNITNQCTWHANTTTRFAVYNPAIKCVLIKAIGTSIASGVSVVTLPKDYRVSTDTLNYSAGYYTSSNTRYPLAANHLPDGNVQVSYATGISADFHLQSAFIVGTQVTL